MANSFLNVTNSSHFIKIGLIYLNLQKTCRVVCSNFLHTLILFQLGDFFFFSSCHFIFFTAYFTVRTKELVYEQNADWLQFAYPHAIT